MQERINYKNVSPEAINAIKSRGKELGWDLIEPLLAKYPLRILGKNSDIPGAIIPKNYAHFVQLFSESHFYIYTIGPSQGDGYNTAMLEAMLLGLPVVTIPNPSSPITHGLNGFIGKNLSELEQHISTLLNQPDLCTQMGQSAKEKVTTEFTNAAFQTAWREVLSGN